MVGVMGKLEAAKITRSHTRTEAMEDGSGGAVVALAGTASSVMRPSQPNVGEKLASLFIGSFVKIRPKLDHAFAVAWEPHETARLTLLENTR